MQLLSLLVLNSAAAAAAAVVPTYPLTGGGSIPALAMGGQNFTGWFAAASSPGNPAMIQTFHGYGNGAILAPQIAAAGRANVFVSTGIPCGCCGSDAAPGVMNASEANKLINDELAQLNVKYVDLLLFHHRCNTTEETAAVWSALEAAKAAGRAHHIGVSNFNAHNLAELAKTATMPVEVLEAHFGVGVMDWEVMKYAEAHSIQPVSFSSTSEASTDLTTFSPAVNAVATAHNISRFQTMYAYVKQHSIVVLSSFDPKHPSYLAEDLAIFDITLTDDEMTALDAVTSGVRTCPDCYTFECQACGQALIAAGCDVGPLHAGFLWGRSNPHGVECMACAAKSEKSRAAIQRACGGTARGETLETMIPKACGI